VAADSLTVLTDRIVTVRSAEISRDGSPFAVIDQLAASGQR
jgi:hypothetical protein